MCTYCIISISFAHGNKYTYNHTSVSSSLRKDTLHGQEGRCHKGRLKHDILGRFKIGGLRSKKSHMAGSSTNIRQTQNRHSQQVMTKEKDSLTKADSKTEHKVQSNKEAKMASKQINTNEYFTKTVTKAPRVAIQTMSAASTARAENVDPE